MNVSIIAVWLYCFLAEVRDNVSTVQRTEANRGWEGVSETLL